MVLVGHLVLIIGFMIFMKVFGLVAKSYRVTSVAKSALDVVRDPNMDDRQKESATRQYSKELFSLFFVIAGASVVALGIPLVVIWVMDLANLVSLSEVIEGTITLEFLGIAAVISAIFILLGKTRFGKFIK